MSHDNPDKPPDPLAPEGGLAGPVIADLITKEVEASRAKAASVQTRGLAVISSSGTLVTLLFGLSALATKAQDFALPAATKVPLYLAAVFLALAAFVAILTNAPRKRDAIALSTLRPLLEEQHWHAPEVHAQREVAKGQLTVLEGERRVNVRMAKQLQWAIAFELLGIVCVVGAVITLIAGT